MRDIKGDKADFTQGELEEIKIVGLSNDDLKDEESYGGKVNASQINSLYIKGNIDSGLFKRKFIAISLIVFIDFLCKIIVNMPHKGVLTVLMPISCERIQSVRDDIANFRFSSLRRYNDIWDDGRWSLYPFTLLNNSVQNIIDENLFILRTKFTMPLSPPPHMEPRHASQFGTSEVYMPRVFGSNRPPIKFLVLAFNQNNRDARFYDMAGEGNDTESLIRLSQSYESTNKKLPYEIKTLFAALGGDSSLMNKRSRKFVYPWVREIAKQEYDTLTL